MVRILILFFLGITCITNGQNNELYFRPGVLKASATITPSDMLASNASNYYISGFLEYQLDQRLSFRGETYVFVDGIEEVPAIKNGFRTYFGAFYHLGKGNFDYTIGGGPGISVLTVNNYSIPDPLTNEVDLQNPHRTLALPSFVLQTGINYYVWKYFHFFANVTYVGTPMVGVSHTYPNRPLNNLDELMFSAGLGFQIQTGKGE